MISAHLPKTRPTIPGEVAMLSSWTKGIELSKCIRNKATDNDDCDDDDKKKNGHNGSGVVIMVTMVMSAHLIQLAQLLQVR